MTLIVTCYTPTGIALSGDSRTTGTRTDQFVPPGAPPGTPPITVQVPWVVSDSTRKLFCVRDRVAIATWGAAFLRGLPTGHHVNDFILSLPDEAQTHPTALADSLLSHFASLATGDPLYFMVAGYEGVEPWVYQLDVGSANKTRVNANPADGAVTYGAYWGGDHDIVGRLVGGQVPIAWNLMNLQDAVDLGRHLIRTTIDQMKFEARVPTVGGPIETITATPSRCRFLVRKELHA
jgi:hypothetical protein